MAPNLLDQVARWKRAAIAVLVLCGAGGCLWSPDIQEAAGEALYPPEIVLENLEPRVDGILTIDESCSAFTFEARTVRDLNLRDVLYVRWYEDYKDDGSVPPVRDLYLAGTGGEERSGLQLKWSVDIAGQILIPAWKQAAHTVTVFVADRPYAAGNGIDFADAEAQYDIWQWPFVVTAGGSCE